MRCKKQVYICDHCGKVAPERVYQFFGDIAKCAPEGWTELGKETLCPVCSETYKRFKHEVAMEMYLNKDSNGGPKTRNVIIFSSEDISDLFRDEPVVMYSKDGTEMVFVSEAGYKAMMKKEN